MFWVIIFALLYTDVRCFLMPCSVASILHCDIYPQQKVCGSDGTTYHSKCSFNQANCRDNTLVEVACPGLASAVTQPATSTVSMPTITNVVTSAEKTSPSTNSATSKPTSEMTSTTTASTTQQSSTTAAPRSTMDSQCVTILSNACPSTFQPVCGSDGKIYPNGCYSSQARCRDPSLTFYYDGRCFSKFTFARRAATTELPHAEA